MSGQLHTLRIFYSVISTRGRTHLLASLPPIAGALAYWNSLSGEFFMDDHLLVTDHLIIQNTSFQGLLEIMTPSPERIEFLPLRDLTYWIDYALWGLDPFGYHLSNVFLYGLCILAVFGFTIKLSQYLGWNTLKDKTTWIAFTTALLFALHPVHSESVAPISGRKEVLSGLFFFLTLESFIRYELSNRIKKSLLVLSSTLFFLAFLSKASVVILPLVVLWLALIQKWTNHEASRRPFPVFEVALFGTISVLLTWLNLSLAWDQGIISKPEMSSLGIPLMASIESFAIYLRITFLPIELRARYSFYYTDVDLDPRFWVSLGMLSALFFLAWFYRRRDPIHLFSLVWFGVSLLPFLGFIVTSTLIAERYLFLAIFPSSFWMASVLHSSLRNKAVTWACLILILGVYSASSVERSRIWNHELSLWKDTAEKEPFFPVAHEAYAAAFWKKNRPEEALAMLEDYRNRDRSSAIYEHFRGRYHLDREEIEEAIQWFRSAERKALFDQPIDLYLFMGQAYEKQGDLLQALAYYRKQLENQRTNRWFFWSARTASESIDRIAERYQPQIERTKKLIDGDPLNVRHQFNLGYLYDILGMDMNAEAEYRRSIRLDATYPYPYINLGNLLTRRGSCEEAISFYQSALERTPQDPSSIYNNLASCYKKLKEYARAKEAFEKAIQLNPKYPFPYLNLARMLEGRRNKAEAIKVLTRLKSETDRTDLLEALEARIARLQGPLPHPR